MVGAQPGSQRFGHRKGDQVVGNGKKFELLPVNPLGRLRLTALRTGAMIAGVIDKMILAAIGTAINLPAQRAGAALQDGLHGAAVGRKDRGAKLPFVDIAQWITFEHRCCRFVLFRLDLQGTDGNVSLSLRGAPGVKKFIETEFRFARD